MKKISTLTACVCAALTMSGCMWFLPAGNPPPDGRIAYPPGGNAVDSDREVTRAEAENMVYSSLSRWCVMNGFSVQKPSVGGERRLSTSLRLMLFGADGLFMTPAARQPDGIDYNIMTSGLSGEWTFELLDAKTGKAVFTKTIRNMK